MKHTQGTYESHGYICAMIGGKERIIGFAWPKDLPPGAATANARLWATSPALVAALGELLLTLVPTAYGPAVDAAARAAQSALNAAIGRE